MSPSSALSSSWSDLPIDILLRIRDKLELHDRSDLISFRSVCSHWHSIVPIPEHLQEYIINLNRKNNVLCFTKLNDNIDNGNNNISKTISISLPFFTSSRIYHFCTSNGWLVFITHNNQNLYLFNPVSNHKIIFSRLSYSILKPTFRHISDFVLRKVVVCPSSTVGIVVACIFGIHLRDKIMMQKRLMVCRDGVGQKWRLMKEARRNIIDITLIGKDHVYALDSYLNLYMLDVSCPSMRLVRFRLWAPKQILQANGVIGSIGEPFSICACMEASRNSYLKINVRFWRSNFGSIWLSLKIDVAELCSYNADADVVDAACEAQWVDFHYCLDDCKFSFTPLLRPTITQC